MVEKRDVGSTAWVACSSAEFSVALGGVMQLGGRVGTPLNCMSSRTTMCKEIKLVERTTDIVIANAAIKMESVVKN